MSAILAACQPAPTTDPRIRVIDPVNLAIYQSFQFAQAAPMVRQAMAFPDMDAAAADAAIRRALIRDLDQKNYALKPDAQLSVRFGLGLRELVEVRGRMEWGGRDGRVTEGRLQAVLQVSFTEVATGTDVWRVEVEGPWDEEATVDANVDRLIRAALRQVPRAGQKP
ncbi:MAG: DUF4136 domain-containing protein [Alphaproteobacteria bacterium]